MVAVLVPSVVRWDRITGLESCWISSKHCPFHLFFDTNIVITQNVAMPWTGNTLSPASRKLSYM